MTAQRPPAVRGKGGRYSNNVRRAMAEAYKLKLASTLAVYVSTDDRTLTRPQWLRIVAHRILDDLESTNVR